MQSSQNKDNQTVNDFKRVAQGMVTSLSTNLFTKTDNNNNSDDNSAEQSTRILKSNIQPPQLDSERALILQSLVKSLRTDSVFKEGDGQSLSLLIDALSLIESKTLKLYKLKSSNQFCLVQKVNNIEIARILSCHYSTGKVSPNFEFDYGFCKCLDPGLFVKHGGDIPNSIQCVHLFALHIYLKNHEALSEYEFVKEVIVDTKQQWVGLCNSWSKY
ncbi:unnamed protein product [Ambrosiozyma monospora]|uniref:Unnamed protein product n=1 Tax=Ambrosiozyma monospora TaxID=43982 RepID=A0A9W7DG73_AMBMO|nr:unnamed protein product [Ambrosiozyma monospora]